MPDTSRRSLPGDLFSRLADGDALRQILDMVEGPEKAIESEWLEFKAFPWADFSDPAKGCEPKNLKDPSRDFIKETWSEVLSAFANTQGGVLVWGIKAAKNADGIDHAEKFELVPNPKQLASRLTELQLGAADPPVPGVEIVPVLDASQAGKGFVVCYVPESPYVPHRAVHKGQQFYHRAMDKSVVIPIPMLRRLFYPQVRTDVAIEGQFTFRTHGREEAMFAEVKLEFSLLNSGNATIRDAYVQADLITPGRGSMTIGGAWKSLSSPKSRVTVATTTPIHPSASLHLVSLEYSGVHAVRRGDEEGVEHWVPDFSPTSFLFFVYADDQPERAFSFNVGGDDFKPDRTRTNIVYSDLDTGRPPTLVD